MTGTLDGLVQQRQKKLQEEDWGERETERTRLLKAFTKALEGHPLADVLDVRVGFYSFVGKYALRFEYLGELWTIWYFPEDVGEEWIVRCHYPYPHDHSGHATGETLAETILAELAKRRLQLRGWLIGDPVE